MVLAVQTGITDGYTRDRNEIIDIGLPPLHNLTGHTVRLRWVRCINQPPSARIISVYAYTYAQVRHVFIAAEGSLPIACPGQYRPAPVTSVVTPPHGHSRWFVVALEKAMTALPGCRGSSRHSRVQLNTCCTSTSQLRLKVCQVAGGSAAARGRPRR